MIDCDEMARAPVTMRPNTENARSESVPSGSTKITASRPRSTAATVPNWIEKFESVPSAPAFLCKNHRTPKTTTNVATMTTRAGTQSPNIVTVSCATNTTAGLAQVR